MGVFEDVVRPAAELERVTLAGDGKAPDPDAVDGLDAGRAGQNMMLTAWAEGVLSCPVGLADHSVCQEVLGYA